MTSDEMAHALGTAALTSKVAYGTACQYGDGTTYVAAVQPSIDASIIELAFKAPGNSVVEGVGDRAVYSAASHALLFVKGATGVSIALNLAAGLRSPELDVLKQLGLIAAARL